MKRYICQDCGHQMLTAQKPPACEVCDGTILLPFEGKTTTKRPSSKPTTMIDVSGFGVKKKVNRPPSDVLPPLPPPPSPPPRPSRPEPSAPSTASRNSRYNPGSLDSTMMNIASKPSVHLDSSMLSSYQQPSQIYQQRQHRSKKFFSLPLQPLLKAVGLGLASFGLITAIYWFFPIGKSPTFTKVVLEEKFTNLSKKWSFTQGAVIKNGGLFHQQPKVKHYGKSIWTGAKFTDVDVSVDVKKVSGPDNVPYGLITRLGGKNYDDFYYLFISGNGTWSMGKHTGDTWEKHGKWRKNKVIKSGNKEINRLRLVAKGNLITAYINGKRVGHFRDTAFSQGNIAVTSFRGAGQPVAVYFDNMVVKIEENPD